MAVACGLAVRCTSARHCDGFPRACRTLAHRQTVVRAGGRPARRNQKDREITSCPGPGCSGWLCAALKPRSFKSIHRCAGDLTTYVVRAMCEMRLQQPTHAVDKTKGPHHAPQPAHQISRQETQGRRRDRQACLRIAALQQPRLPAGQGCCAAVPVAQQRGRQAPRGPRQSLQERRLSPQGRRLPRLPLRPRFLPQSMPALSPPLQQCNAALATLRRQRNKILVCRKNPTCWPNSCTRLPWQNYATGSFAMA